MSNKVINLIRWYTLQFVLVLSIFIFTTNARVGPSTIYDSLTPTVFNNSYLYFDGNVGILHRELDDYPAPMTEYSLSLWFRAQQFPNDLSRTIKLLTVNTNSNGFKFTLGRYQTLTCTANDLSGDLSVSTTNLRLFNWYIIVLRAKPNQSDMSLKELSFDSILS